MMRIYEDFDMLQRYVNDTILELGGKAGVTVFHPWRERGILGALVALPRLLLRLPENQEVPEGELRLDHKEGPQRRPLLDDPLRFD